MRWNFIGQRCEWLDGCVVLSYKIEFHEGLLEIVGLEIMAESVKAGTHLETWIERINSRLKEL